MYYLIRLEHGAPQRFAVSGFYLHRAGSLLEDADISRLIERGWPLIEQAGLVGIPLLFLGLSDLEREAAQAVADTLRLRSGAV